MRRQLGPENDNGGGGGHREQCWVLPESVHWTPIYQSVDGRGCVNKRWFVEVKLADAPVGVNSWNNEFEPFSIRNQSQSPPLDM